MIIMMSGCGTKSLDETSDPIMNVTDTNSSYTNISNADISNTNSSNTNSSNTNSSNTDSSNTNSSNTDDSITDISNTDISIADNTNKNTNTLEIPAPSSNASVDWECGTYYSDISEANLKSYLKLLMENGWKDLLGNTISTEVADGTSEYTLYKGNDLLQIMTFLVDPEVSICNGILIKLDKNIAIADIRNRNNALSKSEAQEKIQDNIENMPNQKEIPSTRRIVTGVFEIFIDDAFEKMNLQAYAAISDNGFTGCFLIRKDVVSHIPGSLNNTCVADIDVDSKYELIDLYGFGSGIFRYQLTAYDFSILPNYCSSIIEHLNRKYYNCFVPKSGYAELVLKKIDDTTVKLVGDGKEYGTLKVNGQNLVVENMQEFPFEEWSKTYDQSILPDLVKEIPSAPPEIKISIDDLGIDYEIRKTQWNGETLYFNSKDAFATIIDKQKFIPTFSLRGIEDMYDIGGRVVTIDFGNSIPDSIQVYDSMFDKQGSTQNSAMLDMERTVKIVDDSRVQFNLQQHMALYLSSNLEDYKKDWYRVFRIVCKWDANECSYVFMINTGMTETLTELPD